MAENTLFYDLSRCLLDHVRDRLADETSEPERSFVSHGPATFDCCPQLSVEIVRVFPGFPGTEIPTTPCATPRTAELSIKLLRCWPVPDDTGNPPPAAEIDAAAQVLAEDLWVMLQGIRVAFSGTCADCKGARFGNVTPIAPQGGCAGWDVRVEAMPDTLQAGS